MCSVLITIDNEREKRKMKTFIIRSTDLLSAKMYFFVVILILSFFFSDHRISEHKQNNRFSESMKKFADAEPQTIEIPIRKMEKKIFETSTIFSQLKMEKPQK